MDQLFLDKPDQKIVNFPETCLNTPVLLGRRDDRADINGSFIEI